MFQFRSHNSVDDRKRGAQMLVAWSSAQHYFNGAEQPYERMKSTFAPSSQPGETWRPIGPGELAPIVSAIAFAIELLLKVHAWQERARPPRGHDFRELWAKLTPTQQKTVAERYAELLNSNLKVRPDLRRVSIAESAETDPSREQPAPTCLAAIADLNKSFEQWRYMHEALDRFPQPLSFHFMSAFTLVHALNDCIKNFRGNRKAEYSIALRSEA